jgi:serine/threonine protein kinase
MPPVFHVRIHASVYPSRVTRTGCWRKPVQCDAVPLTPGTRLGQYSIVRAIGAGGMGEVYLAEDARLRRRVALKVLPSQLALDDAAGKRLLREARAAATLDHPNICTVYEVGEADGCGFIAMQFVDGDNLADRLKKAPFDLLTGISIGRQIADAVAEAHRQGIIHRDIKPQNVMLSPANRVTVLDFGLAKIAAPADAAADTASVLSRTVRCSGLAAPRPWPSCWPSRRSSHGRMASPRSRQRTRHSPTSPIRRPRRRSLQMDEWWRSSEEGRGS